MEWFLVTMAFGVGFCLIVAVGILMAWLVYLCWKPLAWFLAIFLMGCVMRASWEDAERKALRAPAVQGASTNMPK
jgi:hypothetical protein